MAFKISVKAQPEAVYAAVSDLTRHAKWAAHPIKIEALEAGPVKVGSKYNSQHPKGKGADAVTVTELVPNQRFGFRAVMPNKLEFQHSISFSARDGGTLLVHGVKLAKGPLYLTIMMIPLWPLAILIASGPEKKFLKNLKAELEQGK